jgi:hypothetical protein
MGSSRVIPFPRPDEDLILSARTRLLDAAPSSLEAMEALIPGWPPISMKDNPLC